MAEKIREFKDGLLGKAREILKSRGAEFDEKQAGQTLRELNPREEGEGDMFADFEVAVGGEPAKLRLVGQYEENFNPDREKNYDEWDLIPREEALRWLNREIIVNEKLAKFNKGDNISADETVEANRGIKAGDLYLLKKSQEQRGNPEFYGEKEGGAVAKTLLNMQDNLRATDMVCEIMSENSIKTKLELEQKIFEDYFDHFDGYKENTTVILEEVEHSIKDKIAKALERYREAIESRQLEGHEYSLAHGNCNLETVIYTEDGKALLSDWKRAGTTQNKELSLVYDLGEIMADKLENTESLQGTDDFIKGIEEEVEERYRQDDPAVAEAVINLAKFRSFAMCLNSLDGEKKEYALKQLRGAIATSEKI